MGVGKAKGGVKAQCIWPFFIRCQLHNPATGLPGASDSTFDKRPTQSRTTVVVRNAHAFDQTPTGTDVRQIGNKRQLHHAHDLPAMLSNNQFVVGVRIDLLKRTSIGRIERATRIFSMFPERIVSEQVDQGWYILCLRLSEYQFFRHT